MSKTYTDDERVAALAALDAHGGARGAAKATGLSVAVLDHTSRSMATAATKGLAPRSADYAALWGRAVELGAQIITRQLERFADMDLTPAQTRDVAVIAGIAADKHLDYRDGRKGAVMLDNSQHLTLPAGTTLDDLRALRDELRASALADAAPHTSTITGALAAAREVAGGG